MEEIPTCIVLFRAELTCTNKSSLTGRPAGVDRWQLERPMYDFKKFFPLVLTSFIEQDIFFPETYNACIISEPDLTVRLILVQTESSPVQIFE